MISSHFGFTPLREVWIGDCYPAEFYQHLPNELADPLMEITEWTKQDLQHLQTILEGKGIKVQRPKFGAIDWYLDQHQRLIKPPITPRDHYLTLGTTLYSLHWNESTPIDPWQHQIDAYQNQGFDAKTPKDLPVNCLCPPAIVRMGRDLYVDQESHQHIWGFVCQWMVETCLEYRINVSHTGGHSDGVFCPIAPGLIVTSHWKQNYDQSFPGWEVFRVPRTLNNFTKENARWWTGQPEIDNNRAFSNHVLNFAHDWIGNAAETVFEVNMLVIDEHNVVALKEYEPLARWLEQRGVTMHFCNFRARNFWDGGLHCLTLDIHRDDAKTDLFPNRGDNGIYWRLD